MTCKITFLFQLATNVSTPSAVARRIGGWSESWYSADATISAAITRVNATIGDWGDNIIGSRAALLPTGASIVGQRFQIEIGRAHV